MTPHPLTLSPLPPLYSPHSPTLTSSPPHPCTHHHAPHPLTSSPSPPPLYSPSCRAWTWRSRTRRRCAARRESRPSICPPGTCAKRRADEPLTTDKNRESEGAVRPSTCTKRQDKDEPTDHGQQQGSGLKGLPLCGQHKLPLTQRDGRGQHCHLKKPARRDGNKDDPSECGRKQGCEGLPDPAPSTSQDQARTIVEVKRTPSFFQCLIVWAGTTSLSEPQYR